MEMLIPVLLFYQQPLLWVLFLFILLIFFFIEKERALVLLLLACLSLNLAMEGESRSRFTSVFPKEDLATLCGVVVTEPTRRKNRGKGFTLELSSALDNEGNAGSASGTVYVISSFSDITRGDKVALTGTFGEGYFLSSSTEILRRNVWGRGRRKLSSLLERHWRAGDSGNLGSLLLSGSSLDGSSRLGDAARKYGLSYLLALSGMHLGLLQLLLLPLFSKLGNEKEAKLIVLGLLFLFVYSTGWKASLLRAYLFMLLAPLFGKEYGFVLSLLLLLKLEPLSVSDLGTAFSFLSLGGILFLSTPLEKVLGFLLPFVPSLGGALAASASALVFSVPYMLSTFGSWQPMALLLAFPASFLIVVVFFWVVLSLFVPPLGRILEKGIELLLLLAEKDPLWKEETTLRYWWPMAILAFGIKFGEVLYTNREALLQWKQTRLSDLKDILSLWKE